MLLHVVEGSKKNTYDRLKTTPKNCFKKAKMLYSVVAVVWYLTQGACRCLEATRYWNTFLYQLLACLARCLLSEGVRHSSARQAITPARYDEETHCCQNNNAATGERGCQNKSSYIYAAPPVMKWFDRKKCYPYPTAVVSCS